MGCVVAGAVGDETGESDGSSGVVLECGGKVVAVEDSGLPLAEDGIVVESGIGVIDGEGGDDVVVGVEFGVDVKIKHQGLPKVLFRVHVLLQEQQQSLCHRHRLREIGNGGDVEEEGACYESRDWPDG